MDTTIPGLPAEFQPLIPFFVGLVASYLVGPVTAIAKKLGSTTGVTTVTISAALSALLAGLGGYLTGLYGHGWPALWAAVGATVTAFLRANGSYIKGVQQVAVGNVAAKSVTPTVPVTPDGIYPEVK